MNKGYCMDMYKKSYSSFSNNNNKKKKGSTSIQSPYALCDTITYDTSNHSCVFVLRESLTERPRDSDWEREIDTVWLELLQREKVEGEVVEWQTCTEFTEPRYH